MGFIMRSMPALPVEVTASVTRLGANIRLARIRRRITQQELAEACNITRKSVYAIEMGAPGTTVATVFAILWKLGLLGTAVALADPDSDEHGKILEAARRPKRVRHAVDNANDS